VDIIALLLAITSIVLGLILWISKLSAGKAIAEKDLLIQKVVNENRKLSPYEGILNIDREIEKRTADFAQAQQKAKTKILHLRQATEADLEQQKNSVIQMKRETQAQQASVLQTAANESARIIATANQKAEEIAGDAMAALRESKQLEATAKAMKNIIKGYGDEYLVANRSLIDDLAEE